MLQLSNRINSMKQILIVEDEIAYLKLLRRELTHHGYGVIEAADGKRGLDIAIRNHPDLVLLDIRIPVLNGIAVLEELRKDSWGKTAKVILLTNLEPDDETIQAIVRSQPSFYLVKSNIELDELMKKIITLIEGKVVIDK